MPRLFKWPVLVGAACVMAALGGGSALGQQRGDPFEDSSARPIGSTPRPPATPRAASNNAVTRTPGNLRRTTELRPVGGDIRPVAGDIRPSGGDVGVSGGGIRPVEVRSPLQNDAYYEAQLRPRTPRYGVTGHSVNPGWDDPPWGDRELGRRPPPRSSSNATFGGYVESGSSWRSSAAAAGGLVSINGEAGGGEVAGGEASSAPGTRAVRLRSGKARARPHRFHPRLSVSRPRRTGMPSGSRRGPSLRRRRGTGAICDRICAWRCG
jgi:hypothetical protein